MTWPCYIQNRVIMSSIIKGLPCNSKMSGLIRPKIELDRAFMPVLVTNNFDDDIQSKMNKLAWRRYFPIISLWEIFYMLKGS